MMDPSDTDFSLLLWTLGLFVAGLGWHLSNGWLRQLPRTQTLLQSWPALALAAAALAVGLNAALLLALQAQPMAFALGFHALGGGALLLGSWLICLPVVVLSAATTSAWRLLLSGALLAALALALQMGWVHAAGFRPGVLWRHDALAAAAVVLLIGVVLARWMAFSAACEASPRRVAWRLAAAVVAAVALLAGQEMVVVAAGLNMQRGSLHANQLNGTVVSLVCGVLVPLVMAGMVLDLWLRRNHGTRRSGVRFQPGQRRKRRQRIRTL